eukprot:gene3657-2591_t
MTLIFCTSAEKRIKMWGTSDCPTTSEQIKVSLTPMRSHWKYILRLTIFSRAMKAVASVVIRCGRNVILKPSVATATPLANQWRGHADDLPSGSASRPAPRRVKPADEEFADAFDEDTSAPQASHFRHDPFVGVPTGTALFSQDGGEEPVNAGGQQQWSKDPNEASTEWVDGDGEESVSVRDGDGLLPNEERILERREMFRAENCSLSRLLDRTMNYLRSTHNEKLVDAEEEDVLFPVIKERFKEFSVDQLLEIVSCLHARSTLVRYGTEFNDLVRDRIAVIASTAAKQRQSAVQNAAASEAQSGTVSEDEPLFVDEAEEQKRIAEEDPILSKAAEQMTPDTVLRSLLVMGMSARRKRDLAFFHTLGAYFAFYINHYKDPHDLVRVLTAFARAKILPPKSFLLMLSRRFPVLCKTNELETLPCYRAMVNFSKMGHDQMNIYRFLSDSMLSTIESNITERKRQLRLAQLRQQKEQEDSKENVARSEGKVESPSDGQMVDGSTEGLLSATKEDSTLIKSRFHDMVGVRPSMFTKWLLILSRNGAPFQQYLRPFIQPIIVPMLGHFPSPSFTRLLSAISYFKCDDADLLEPILDFMCDGAGSGNSESEEAEKREVERSYCPTRADLFVLLTMFSREGTTLPGNTSKFFKYCGDVFLESSLAMPIGSPAEVKKKKRIFKGQDEQFVLRPGDMCSIARHLVQLQRRVEIPLEDLAPLRDLMGHFVRRLHALLQLGVVSVLQVDDFADLCRQQLYADEDGSLEKLMALRRELAPFVDEDGMVEEEEAGPALDIDVKETFFKIVLVNDAYRYIAYRPLPGALQVDFREALTKISALDMLEAVDLYERCFPTALKPPVRLLLSRSFQAKFSKDGEEVMSEDGSELILRQPPEQLVTRKDLEHFVELIGRTPMSGIRESPDIQKFVEMKAQRLGLKELLKSMAQKQAAQQTVHQ